MTALVWQTALLLLSAYFLGAWIACLIRRTFFWRQRDEPRVTETAYVEPQDNSAGILLASEGPSPVAAASPLATILDRSASASSLQSPRPGLPVAASHDQAALEAEERDIARRVNALHAVARAAGDGHSAVIMPRQQSVPDGSSVSPTAGAAGVAASGRNPRGAEAGPAYGDAGMFPVAAGTSGLASVAAPTRRAKPPADDFAAIQGIGPSVADQLVDHGVARYADIAGWTAADVARIETLIGAKGRIGRENWIEQAKILATGGQTQYSTNRALPAAVQHRDDLTCIQGVNSEIQRFLNGQGVFRFSQIAAWTAGELARIDGLLGVSGRISREDWIGQASSLCALRPAQLPGTQRASPAPDRRSPAGSSMDPRDAGSAEPEGEDGGDDLKLIRGIGPLLESKLHASGVTRFDQIASWTARDIARIAALLDFKDRIEREDWIGQARILASGGSTEFSDRQGGRS